MLYTSFDEKDYDNWHDDDQCIKAFLEKEEEINLRKQQVMEWLEDVEEGRHYVEEVLKNEINTEEIGDELDAAKEQDDAECEDEGIEMDPMYQHLDLGDHNEHDFTPSSTWCKKIELKDDEQLTKSTHHLDEYQRKTLDICLKFARDIVKAHKNHKNALPEATCLVVLGGAGSGKSTVINSLTQWIQKTLQKPGDDPLSPYILATGTTGAASVLVEGMTIHSAVGLTHGHKHNSLSDKRREIKREQFKNLKILIIDEFSMMGSDQLYQIDLRLRELKQMNKTFGGVSVCLFGDPAQLKPVRQRFVSDKPCSEEYHLAYGDGSESLWRSFRVIFLMENHRQGNHKTYAEILNRMRVGEQTKEDIELLKTRVRPKNHPDLKDALYIACTKVSVNEHNTKCLNDLPGTLYESKAKHFTKLKSNFKPHIQKDGSISDTGFPDILKLKIGARVMMIYNIDVSDLLCNGAMGTLIGAEMSKDGKVDKFIVKFDMPRAGEKSRQNHPNYTKKYPGGTVITRIEREYTLAKNANTIVASTARLIQYPLILAFAVTVHKVQGQTIEQPLKCVIDIRTVFQGAQGYVMGSRVKEMDQLFILEDLPEKKIYPNQKALEEIERLWKVSINNNPTPWDSDATSGVTKISFLNTRSLINKFDNIKLDLNLRKSDLMVLAETWIPHSKEKNNKYELECFEAHLNNCGRGKGLAMFYKQQFKHTVDLNGDNMSITKMESLDIDVIAIYRSQGGNLRILVDKLQDLIKLDKNTLIIGDLNVCSLENPQNQLWMFLKNKSFKQIVKKATHIDGGHIDHAYIMNKGNYEEEPNIEIVPKYFSDHDAICISWKKKQLNNQA